MPALNVSRIADGEKRGDGLERRPLVGIARERETSAGDAALFQREIRTLSGPRMAQPLNPMVQDQAGIASRGVHADGRSHGQIATTTDARHTAANAGRSVNGIGSSSRTRRCCVPQVRLRIPISPATVAAFCQRNQIRRFSVCGSVLRQDFGPESDVDVLVEFAPEARVGYIRLAGMERELSGILGRPADMHTVAGLKP